MKTLNLVLDGQEIQVNDSNKAWFEQTPIIGYYYQYTEEELSNMKIIVDSKTGTIRITSLRSGYRLPYSGYHQDLDAKDKNWRVKDQQAYYQVMNMSDEDCICKIKQMISTNKFDPYFIAQTQYKINNKLWDAFDETGNTNKIDEQNWNILMRFVDKFRRLHSKFQHEVNIYFYLTD